MKEFRVLPSENIIELRKLTDQICLKSDNEILVDNIKQIINRYTEQVISIKTEKTKLKYYEQMFSELKSLIK